MKIDTETRLVVTVIVAMIISLVALLVYLANQPSCEDRGGKLRKTGYILTTQMIGKVVVSNMVPVYTCDMPK